MSVLVLLLLLALSAIVSAKVQCECECLNADKRGKKSGEADAESCSSGSGEDEDPCGPVCDELLDPECTSHSYSCRGGKSDKLVCEDNDAFHKCVVDETGKCDEFQGKILGLAFSLIGKEEDEAQRLIFEAIQDDSEINGLLCDCMEQQADCIDEGDCTVTMGGFNNILGGGDDEDMADMMEKMMSDISCRDLCSASLCERVGAASSLAMAPIALLAALFATPLR
eukprot:TRINITY_DN408_c0_g3_i1.p1 TRINITY_DN408_c0_g3~~TRINITY_DN408_c0_g3_i1.p1  ORF type:complete len:225 (-),score=72.96 TRINITY_DN408_c0_g3_i1:171-845(-)